MGVDKFLVNLMGGATGVPYCVQLCLDGLGSIASTRSFTLSCGCFPLAGLYYGVIMLFFLLFFSCLFSSLS